MDEELPVQEERAPERISRRKALKRMGAAGAVVAWSAPLVSSLRTPAFAQSSPRCGEPPCGTACGGEFVECGDQCICIETVEGTCACIQFNVGFDNCTSSSDCGADIVCVNDTCRGDVCQPLCGSATVAARASGGTNLRA